MFFTKERVYAIINYKNTCSVYERGHIHMDKEQYIQEIMKMLFKADEKQLKRLIAFIKAYLRLE